MNHIKKWLLSKEIEQLDVEKNTFKTLSKTLEKQKDDYNQWVQTRNSTDACRERFAGFDFKENEKDLIDSIPKERIMEYLEAAVTIKEGELLPFLIDYMNRKQIESFVFDSKNIESVNFGRATINGLALIDEGLDTLVVEYKKRTGDKERFDKFNL